MHIRMTVDLSDNLFKTESHGTLILGEMEYLANLVSRLPLRSFVRDGKGGRDQVR